MLATTFVVCSPITFAALLFTRMIRYGRPVTLWNVGVNVIGPPSVLNLNRCDIVAASLAPSVEPPFFLIAYAMASIASAPVWRPPRDLLRPELDPARRWQVEPGEQVDERRLPGPVRADQPEHLVGRQLEVDVLEGLDPLERARDSDCPERWVGPRTCMQGPTLELSRQSGQWMLATTFVVCSPITLATLLLTTTIR